MEDWGGPSTFPHYAIGWAWAGDHAVPVDQADRVPLRRNHERIRQGIPPRQGPGLARGMRDAATHHAPGIQIAHSLIL